MTVALRKIFGDLRHAWGRVLLLFLAVAIGQAAMTASFSTLTVINREIERNFSMAAPPEALVEATGFDAADFERLPPAPGVFRMDVMSVLNARYRLDEGEWRPIVIFGRRDFTDLRALRVFPKSGAWPPVADEILIERSGLPLLDAAQGETLEIGFDRGDTARLRFAGVVHDPTQAPSFQENTIYGYVDLETFAAMAGARPVQFLIFLELGASPLEATQSLSKLLAKRGARVVRVRLTPLAHPHADLMDGLLLLLACSSLLSFVIALFLSGSIVASLVQRQERQMAVLRALGARRQRIAALQLGFALAPAIAGLMAGAALGAFGAGLLESLIAWELNLDIADTPLPRELSYTLLAVGGAGVLCAGLLPVASSLRRPVRQALQGAPESGRPWLRLAMLAPLDQLAVAEAFRRPVRTTIAVLALMVAGAAVISSANTFASLVGVVDRFLASRTEDLTTTMTDTPDVAALRSRLDRIEGLTDYEFWDVMAVTASASGLPETRLSLASPPPETRMGMPSVVAGRLPAAAGEIAVSQLLANTANLAVGAEISLNDEDRSTVARVVGLVDVWGMSIWTEAATFAQLAGANDRNRQIKGTTDPGREAEVSLAVEEAVLAAGSFPSNTMTRGGFRSTMVNHFLNFFQFLSVACLTAAAVGAAALSSSIGSNVLERAREIGVLRTLGATSNTVFRLVLGQALSLSVLSLTLALLVAVPLTAMVVGAMEKDTLRMFMPVKVSWVAVAGWCAASLLIAVAAALAPALRIRSLPIREAIAHE